MPSNHIIKIDKQSEPEIQQKWTKHGNVWTYPTRNPTRMQLATIYTNRNQVHKNLQSMDLDTRHEYDMIRTRRRG